MPTSVKPDDYPSVSPYLVADDPDAVIDFIETVFDGTTERRYDDPEGRVHHVELRIGDGVVMMGGSSEGYPATESLVHVYVPDVDATYRAALDAGGESIQEPTEVDGDPDRRGLVRGPGGNSWAIATQVHEAG